MQETVLHERMLVILRNIMDRIHEGGNIYYDKDRYDAYKLIAKLASDERTAWLKSK